MESGAAALPPDQWAKGLDRGVLAEAGAAAEAAGVSLDAYLLGNGIVDETVLYRAFAQTYQLPFEEGAPELHPGTDPFSALRSGFAPLAGAAGFLAAPRGAALEALANLARTGDARGIVVTTPARLRHCIVARFGAEVHDAAVNELSRLDPRASARIGLTLPQLFGGLFIAALLAFSFTAAAATSLAAVSLLFSALFLANITVRLACLREAPRAPIPVPTASDRDLPVYTILAPLFRETGVLRQFVQAMLALKYPLAKLDIKLLLEEDDRPMRAAVAALNLPGCFEVVVAPRGKPRTKPRALNIGLATARGEFLVIYDAEDRPDPGQLREAVTLFRALPPRVACLQGRLVIDNTRDSWLTRLFTIEYAALFDVMIPGLARLDLPVMLGGTTNHFRVSALLDVGGWDAWNVTEDADLGLRLARCGFSVSDLPSQTLEEAPASLDAWMAQRTRWLKGWLQTTAVHLRNPRLALSTMGGFAYGSALAVCLGTVATALFGPLFFGLALFDLITGRLAPTEGFGGAITSSISLTLFGAGLLTVLGTAWVGMRRRGVAELAPWLLLMPAYLLLASVAAWRAVAEVIVAPQQWNKTQHGMARTSRAATVVNDHRQARRRRASMRGKTRYGT